MKFTSPLFLAFAATLSVTTAQTAVNDDDDFAHVTFFSDKACERIVRVAALRPNQCSRGQEEFGSMMVDAAPKNGNITVFGNGDCGQADQELTQKAVEGKCIKIADDNDATSTSSSSSMGPTGTSSSSVNPSAPTGSQDPFGTPTGTPQKPQKKKTENVTRRKQAKKQTKGLGQQKNNQNTGNSGKGKSVKFSPGNSS